MRSPESASDAALARRLFRDHPAPPAVLASALEGRSGTVALHREGARAVARVELGCYAAFAGDPHPPRARRWLEAVGLPREIIVPDDPAWHDLLEEVHGPRSQPVPMQCFRPTRVDAAACHALVDEVADPFRVTRMAAGHAEEMHGLSLTPNAMEVFESARAFEAEGIGYCVRSPRDGLVSASTTYAISSGMAEVAVSTLPQFRGRGFATAAAAALVLHCLDAGLEPNWSAANPSSQRLAVRLGFVPDRICPSVLVQEQTGASPGAASRLNPPRAPEASRRPPSTGLAPSPPRWPRAR